MSSSNAKNILDEFFQNLKDFGDRFSMEDIDVAVESLQIAFDDLKLMKKAAVEKKKEAELKQREEDEKREKEEKIRKQKEHIEEVTCMDLPLDWNNPFNADERASGIYIESISDALVKSLTTLGRVDIEFIASVTGSDYKTVITTLKGSIYQNPLTWNECFYQGWETADEYLSGNLMQKWKEAKKANKTYNGYFEDNVKAIESVLPPTVATEDIYITLGSPWVPSDVIDDFIEHLFGGQAKYWSNSKSTQEYLSVKHDELTGTWEIPEKTRYGHGVTDTDSYGTSRLEALYILERTLNMKTIAVKNEVACKINASGKKRVINKEETLLALEKQQKMIKEFQDWVWKDEKRKKRLETIFENKYSCVRRRIFDGSFLTFPDLSPNITLFPYQKNAVARIIFTPNTLLAHDVGSGKTYIMIASGMELRRMGLSKKNLYVVPNNIVGQWQKIFIEMYPNARLLTVEPKSFVPSKRDTVLEKIRDEEFDGIIMAYSCFEQIPLSLDFYIDELRNMKEKVNDLLSDSKKVTKSLKKKNEKLGKQLAVLATTLDNIDCGIFFDELGISRLYIDEAHNYKNVPIETKADNVLGITRSGSKKCKDMLDKVRVVQKSGGGVVMATGTPITNSITDAFIMQKYLQNGELGLLDLQNFDSWIGMFAEKSTEFEIDVDTSSYRLATRFSKFHNLPELTTLFSQIADFHHMDEVNGIPAFDGYSDALIGKTLSFENYLNLISSRADDVRAGFVNRSVDNMLKITTDGRKAALDIRLVDSNEPFTQQSKVYRCAENVFDIYLKTDGTQLVFCDTSTPKSSFNMYDELKRLLIEKGILPSQIAFVHDATTEAKRNTLFKMMRNGEIRVLIGSTFKLGIGVNVQDKLIAIHHLDVPWRPADMTQREGRILRQGNQNPKVQIFRYITEGSFDAYSWQLLETKQRFITSLLSGSYTEREGSDIEDTVLNYAEIKALAVGNPLVKKRVETANELSCYYTLQRKLVETRIRLDKELKELPSKMLHQKELINKAMQDKHYFDQYRKDVPVAVTSADKNKEAEKRKLLRETLFNAVKNNELQIKERTAFEYCGFKIILPANMAKVKPFVWLEREGKYYVELGDTEVGVLIRIDNYLNNLDKHIENQQKQLFNMGERKKGIQKELGNDENYADVIAELKEKLAEIDDKLGVNKK